MSPDFYRSQIQSSQKKIGSLQQDKARESDRISGFQKRASSASQAASRATSASAANSRRRDIERAEKDIASAHKKISGIESKISGEMGRLARAQSSLAKEETRLFQKRAKEEEKRVRESTRNLTRMSRQLDDHDKAIQDLSKLPAEIVILFVASNPLDQTALRLDEEVREVEAMIRKSDFRDSVKLHSHWAARPLDLIQKINEIKPTVLHISGHGSDQAELVFQDDDGATKLVTKDAFVQTLAATVGSLKLIFLNSCHSHVQAEAACQFVPAAVGMRDEIGDEAARIFASRFYAAIGFGMNLESAFQQGKAALMLENIPEENTPVLFSNDGIGADEIILVDPGGNDSRSSRGASIGSSFKH